MGCCLWDLGIAPFNQSRLRGTIGASELPVVNQTEVRLANLTGLERARYVQDMFTRIAQRYDLMNRVMTVGQDVRWRREVIRRAQIPREGRILDLGAGVGCPFRAGYARSSV